MPTFTTLIVGAHFRPPAKQVLGHIAQGTELIVQEDNNNAYDPAAVQVLFDPALIPDSEYSSLEPELNEAGITLEQLMSGGPIQLGFVPAQSGKPLAKARAAEPGLLGNHQVREIMGNGQAPKRSYRVQLGFAADGSPRAQIIVED